jgi:hypothetical protein
MIAAGLYGFIDMAGDVTNGTMIRYDQGNGVNDNSAAAIGVTLIDKAQVVKQAKTSKHKIVAQKKETASTKKTMKQIQPVKESPIEKIIVKEEPVEKKFTSDVVPDSTPAVAVEESIDYSDFSRGDPRPHKKKKKSKK